MPLRLLLKSIRLRKVFNDRITGEDKNRRILARIRNWFIAAIKANDKNVLSVILEVIKRMNMDPGKMAEIKFGKPLILLMSKDEPSISISTKALMIALKAQLTSLQKTAYEAYGKTYLRFV